MSGEGELTAKNKGKESAGILSERLERGESSYDMKRKLKKKAFCEGEIGEGG